MRNGWTKRGVGQMGIVKWKAAIKLRQYKPINDVATASYRF
ncbi:hypothetical protein Pla110_20310 [Polystyrenella longa]|uniref:Uncharacterized protein n=1 Tax=Polystyrenella longa TaxID=2528007 RepID=A0A518CM93_9PLAN|nr:hypothetical protein Pla110_20310 [Polystyrenella longa]